ncbi:MAG: hypothetical protein KA444_05535 [Bacteroidia bacterium]|nr:hypothetical protein [Bacteroidia bacterium]
MVQPHGATIQTDNEAPDKTLVASLHRLRLYIESEEFKGYDPYDTLTSPIPFSALTRWTPVIVTQIQKRNPVNIRPILRIKKDYNPKAIGLLLKAYVQIQQIFPSDDYSNQIGFLFNWLSENASKDFSGPCWGYNFGWASPEKYLPPNAPTVVATSFIAQGIHEYFLWSKNTKAAELLKGIAEFITKDLPVTNFSEGICYSYSPFMTDCCYNASLLAAETLARVYSMTGEEMLKEKAISATDFVVSKQHPDGHWKYKIDPVTSKERHQVDFHQGYILDSIQTVMFYCKHKPENWTVARRRGLDFYLTKQFFQTGRSLWRLPTEYPVEIHNQSQGIITFSRAANEGKQFLSFANTISSWTIKNMQDKKSGYFYYRKLRFYTNKLSFMRWNNAWMLLALSEHLLARKQLTLSQHA